VKPEELIHSGLLEMYAFDACTTEEKLVVEQMLAQYPEVQQELDLIQKSLYHVAEQNAITPPAHIKHNIKSQLTFKTPETVASPLTVKHSAFRKNQLLTVYKVGFAASLLATCLMGYLALSYRSELKNTQEQLAELTTQNSVLSENVNRASLQYNSLNKQVAVLKNTDFKACKLAGVPNFPEASMVVYWNPKSQETYVSIDKLPELPEGKQFQLWALVDGKPIDAGVFDATDSTNLIQVSATLAAQMFAVTIENTGGSATPTLTQMVVAGKI
jgi:anti-sigma-K factor RskA